MKTDELHLLRELFERAVALSPDERAGWIEAHLRGKSEGLRSRLEAMLEAAAVEDAFLEPPDPFPSEAPLVPGAQAVAHDRTGSRIGSFVLLRLIAAGGMGAVYEAEQQRPRRRVALKLMHPGATGPKALARFRDESDLLARLSHPGIAQVYETGVLVQGEGDDQEEIPWFAMELVEGARSLVRFASEEALDLHRRLELFVRVCASVHHGHLRGVLHRDLKPANLLVDGAGNVKVIDFGVAKALDAGLAASAERTQQGEIVGTLLYMSPEQIAGRHEDVDVRTDVYALGLVLFELVCHRRPFTIEGLSLQAAARVLAEDDPPAPGTLVPGLANDLDWVLARALAKEPQRRYASVAELADDLNRFLRHEPVAAGPPSRVYHMRKFVRRHRTGVTAAIVVLLALLGGLVGVGFGLVRALRAEALAQEERVSAEAEARKATAVVDFLVDVFSSADPARSGRDVTMRQVLARADGPALERFAAEPEVQARLEGALGSVYHGLGDDEEAEAHLREALAILRREPGEPNAETVDVLNALGDTLSMGGRLEEAESFLLEARQMAELLAGEDVRVSRVTTSLGRLRLAQSRRDEAEALLREAIDGFTQRLGPRHRDTLVATNDLAGVLHEGRRFDEAAALYREALGGMVATLGDEHPETVRLRANLAGLLYTQGDKQEAIELTAVLLETRRRLLGEDHPDTLRTITNLASMLHSSGRMQEAAPLYREGIERMGRTLAPEHPVLQTLRQNLGILEKERGDFGAAEEILGELYETRRAGLGPGNEATLRTLYDLAQLARERGELELARERAEAGLQQCLDALGEEHYYVYQYLTELGWTLTGLGAFDEAEATLDEAARRFAIVGPSTPGLRSPEEARRHLADARAAGGD